MSFIEEFRGYTLGSTQYLRNKNKSGPIRLAMAMQVKDEVDIVKNNIVYHANKGCDAFFIVDNASTDGTREVLEELSKEYDLTIVDDLTPDHNQSQNMTMLTLLAQKRGFDWVIENDADEFWYPESGSLLTGLNRDEGVLRVQRFNVLPQLEEPDNWFRSPWHTQNTIHFDMYSSYSKGENNFLFAPVLHKVMVNPHGIIGVGGGNHGARHVIDKFKGKKFSNWNNNLKIFHFALRSYERFEKKVQNINKSLNYTAENGYKKHNFGPQAVYWNDAYVKGELRQVYDDMLLSNDDIPCMKKLGLISFDDAFVKDYQNSVQG